MGAASDLSIFKLNNAICIGDIRLISIFHEITLIVQLCGSA